MSIKAKTLGKPLLFLCLSLALIFLDRLLDPPHVTEVCTLGTPTVCRSLVTGYEQFLSTAFPIILIGGIFVFLVGLGAYMLLRKKKKEVSEKSRLLMVARYNNYFAGILFFTLLAGFLSKIFI